MPPPDRQRHRYGSDVSMIEKNRFQSRSTGSKPGPIGRAKAKFASLSRPLQIIIVVVLAILLLLPLLGLLALRNDDGGDPSSAGENSGPGTTLNIDTSAGTFRGAFSYVSPFPDLTQGGLWTNQTGNGKNIRVRSWLGVPYAASTEGQNRFMPPQRRTVPDGVQMARSNSVTCPQKLGLTSKAFLSTIGVETEYQMGEDCLTVNIFAPSGMRANSSSAVMIWFYGGAFQFGANSLATYDASRWVAAQDDVMIVTINYRMSFWGFPMSPHLQNSNNGSVNLGLLDARAAVDWVYDNIANFGGDPNRITLFGQSAGGIQADTYVFAYPDDTRIKGVITTSGGASNLLVEQYPDTLSSLGSLTSAWNALSFAMGCGALSSSGNPNQLSCMQNLNLTKLISAVTLDPFTFRPAADNVTFFPSYTSLLSSGTFAKVPILASTTSEENNIYAKVVNGGRYSDSVRDRLNLQNGTWALWCAARSSVLARRRAGVKAWQITYHGDFPNISPDEGLGAYHTSDVPVTFGTYDKIQSNESITSPEAANSAYMQGLYTAFARDPQNGLVNYGLRYPDGSTTDVFDVSLGNDPTAQLQDATARVAQYACPS